MRWQPIAPFDRFWAIVNHCMFHETSGPPQASGMTWSTSHPGHEPVARPVTGHGWARRNVLTAAAERFCGCRGVVVCLLGLTVAGRFGAGARDQ